MKKKTNLLFIGIVFCTIVLLAVFIKKNVLFSDADIFMLSDKIQIQYEDSYIELTNFKLEDDIAKIELMGSLGNPSDWKELTLLINSHEYPLKTNVVTSVTGEESINMITSIGELDSEMLKEGNSVYLLTPYEKIEINYTKKNILYY
ncbi:hypothetical protein DCE79_09675 [Lysinibacillus sp. 2017]|uniref:hypothetical protein n=1 Tax=unclassified Lysinibacillus TaxID=2636778 RepID=UPI000D5275E8|nr:MULTISPECIES: hypothetical protein [unclassified Lysinibacillus]AWE07635.1 hypothetical protein DCE79_09675 [Lysinibacillus sp. 2017]TGN36798.1 hypothetical protein E4L99_04380 [Lysinibacillus sp. S2017]